MTSFPSLPRFSGQLVVRASNYKALSPEDKEPIDRLNLIGTNFLAIHKDAGATVGEYTSEVTGEKTIIFNDNQSPDAAGYLFSVMGYLAFNTSHIQQVRYEYTNNPTPLADPYEGDMFLQSAGG